MSKKKLPYIHPSLMPSNKKINPLGSREKKEIITWSRASTIDESFVSKKIRVHNGKNLVDILVNPSMVGYKLGEFARTRRRGKDPRPKASRLNARKK